MAPCLYDFKSMRKIYWLEVDFGQQAMKVWHMAGEAGILGLGHQHPPSYSVFRIASSTKKVRATRKKKLEAFMLACGFIPVMFNFQEYEETSRY